MQAYVNDYYFNVIDTEAKAYFVGFLMADGGLVKGSHTSEYIRVSLHVSQEDLEIVKKFKAEIESEHTIFIGKKFNDCALRFVSRQMVYDLMEFGIVPKKTGGETLNIENIPSSLLRHTIRGLIDGDGWVSVGSSETNIGICGSYNICNFVQSYFSATVGTSPLKVSKVKDKDCYKIGYSSIVDQYKIIHHLYKDSTIYLSRKARKANEILKLAHSI